MKGYIYLIRNLVNGKGYVGQTRISVSQRFRKHKENARCNEEWAICRAIKKYGIENFTVTEIVACDPIYLNNLEKHYIEFFGTFGPNGHGYNMTSGGDSFARAKGWHHTEEWKLQNSIRNKGRKHPPRSAECRKRQSEAIKGKTHSQASKDKVSAKLKGRQKPPRSAEHNARIAASKKGQNKGVPWSNARREAETRRKGGA